MSATIDNLALGLHESQNDSSQKSVDDLSPKNAERFTQDSIAEMFEVVKVMAKQADSAKMDGTTSYTDPNRSGGMDYKELREAWKKVRDTTDLDPNYRFSEAGKTVDASPLVRNERLFKAIANLGGPSTNAKEIEGADFDQLMFAPDDFKELLKRPVSQRPGALDERLNEIARYLEHWKSTDVPSGPPWSKL